MQNGDHLEGVKGVDPKSLFQRWVSLCAHRPMLILLCFLTFSGGALFQALSLSVNTNQLDMISAESRHVKDIERVTDMIGGAGNLTVALRGDDPEHLKEIARALSEYLTTTLEAEIRDATYKVPTQFLTQRAALFMKTKDLQELKRRVMLKVRDARKRADPFFFEISPTPPVELKVDDLLEKYSKVGKKRIADAYYISADQEMQLVQVKPMWDSNRLEETGALVDKIRAWFKTCPSVKDQVTCIEEYSSKLPETSGLIEYGFTGTYQTNYDDSYQMKSSLVPVSGVAFIGVLLVLLAFFGRHIFAVFLILSGLILGLIITFGWAALTLGELNMITSILGGILMGLGIDFGIHLLYRLREEMERQPSLEEALSATLKGAGVASFVSGLGTAAAFASLLTSDFKGFSHFGFLAGSGVFLIGVSIYIWVPALIFSIERGSPGRAQRLIGAHQGIKEDGRASTSIPRPLLILSLSALIAVGLSTLAPQAPFEYNTRALMVEGLPSVKLQDELNDRFQISADPVAIYTPTLEGALAVYERFKSAGVNVGIGGRGAQESRDQSITDLHKDDYSSIDQVVSLFTFIPPQAQQERNAALLKTWREELSEIPKSSLPPELQERWGEGLSYLDATPYQLKDLPAVYVKPFKSLPTSKTQGYLTYVYAQVDLWDGKNMLKFAEQVEVIHVEGGPYYAAGMPILFSGLAQMILADGRLTVILTCLLLLLILALDLKKISDVLIALTPLLLGVGSMLGVMSLIDAHLNLMNVVVFPIIIGYGVSHGVYLLHRVKEGASPKVALSSVGRAVACSTLTTLAGWAALLVASHRGLKSMGTLACVGMLSTLFISFTLMPAILEILRNRPATKIPKSALSTLSIWGLCLIGVTSLITGCGGAQQTFIHPEYERFDQTNTTHISVRVHPISTTHDLSSSATSPLGETSQKIREMWALMAQRYLNSKRDFFVSSWSPTAGDQEGGQEGAPSATSHGAQDKDAPLCSTPFHGILELNGHIYKESEARVFIRLKAQIKRCDQTLVWSAELEGDWPAEDDILIDLRRRYSAELGEVVRSWASPSFYALKSLLSLAPLPKLSETLVMEKIDFEE